MFFLLLGILIFFELHLTPCFPSIRNALADRVGEKLYKIIFSVLSAIGLILIGYGKATSPFLPMYEPVTWSIVVVPIMMFFSLTLLAAANMPGNIRRHTRHPMLWGVVLWSAAHLLSNGDLASIILFGSFGLYALFDMFSANRRGATKQSTRLPLIKDLMVVAAGLVATIVLLLLHPYLFGVSVL